MPSNWRQATPMERAQWVKWVEYFEGRVTRAVIRAHTAAQIAGKAQDFLDQRGLSLPSGPIITTDEADRTRELFRMYNTVGRIMLGVHAGKYGIKLYQGDIDVLAPPDMPKEEYQEDQITIGPLEGIPLIIWAIVVGATLVGGLWAGSEMMEASAKQEYTRYKKKILEADEWMMTKPPDVRSDWIKRRRDFEKMTEQVKEKTGILVDIFGSKHSAWITAAVIAGLALLAMRLVPKEK